MDRRVALFGEAERGEFKIAYSCKTLADLETRFGEPPQESRGLYYAVQAILFEYDLIFFRVKEEGYSLPDYLFGLHILERGGVDLTAICIPGVGNPDILSAAHKVCVPRSSLIITSESDFYDLMTSSK